MTHRLLYGWQGWLPRYEHTKETVPTAFYHKRLYLWYVCIQWSYNNAPVKTLEQMFKDRIRE